MPKSTSSYVPFNLTTNASDVSILDCKRAYAAFSSSASSYCNAHPINTTIVHSTVEASTAYSYEMTTLCDRIPRIISSRAIFSTNMTRVRTATSPACLTYPEKSPNCSTSVITTSSQDSGCRVRADSVRLFFWPQTVVSGGLCGGDGTTLTAIPSGNGPNTAVIDGKTITSPTVLLSFGTISVSMSGSISSVFTTNTAFEMEPDAVSSLQYVPYPVNNPFNSGNVMPWANNFKGPYPFNYADLNHPVPWTVYSRMQKCVNPQGCVTITEDDYAPVIVYPEDFIKKVNPEWSTCWLDYGPNGRTGSYDPPSALGAMPTLDVPIAANPSPTSTYSRTPTSAAPQSLWSTPTASSTPAVEVRPSVKATGLSLPPGALANTPPFQSLVDLTLSQSTQDDTPVTKLSSVTDPTPSTEGDSPIVNQIAPIAAVSAGEVAASSSKAEFWTEYSKSSTMDAGTPQTAISGQVFSTSPPNPASSISSSLVGTGDRVPTTSPVYSRREGSEASNAAAPGHIASAQISQPNAITESQTATEGGFITTISGVASSTGSGSSTKEIGEDGDNKIASLGITSHRRTLIATVVGQTITLDSSQLGQITIGSHTTTGDGAAAIISGTPVSLGSDALIIGSSTIPLLPHDIQDKPGLDGMIGAVITAATQVISPAATVTIGSKPYTVQQGGNFALDSTTLSVGGSAIMVSGEILSLASSGVVIGGTTHDFAAGTRTTTSGAVLTIGSQAFTAVIPVGGAVIGSTTLTIGDPAAIIPASIVSAGSSDIAVGGETLAYSGLTSMAASDIRVEAVFILNGGAYTAIEGTGSDVLVMGSSTTYKLRSSPVMIDGHAVSVAMGGIGIGGSTTATFSTIERPTVSATAGFAEAMFTIGSTTFTALQQAEAPGIVAIGSETLSVGGGAITLDGHTISGTSNGILVGSTITALFSTMSPTFTSGVATSGSGLTGSKQSSVRTNHPSAISAYTTNSAKGVAHSCRPSWWPHLVVGVATILLSLSFC